MTFETEFTPWAAMAGGALIGLSAVLLMALHGRIMGATGILSGMLFPAAPEDRSWRLALVLGMISGPLILLVLSGGALPRIEVPVSAPMLILGGAIVGVGVTLSGGCTSGHGVCGMARLSPRSLAATVTFMACAFATVYVIRHLIGA